MFRGAHWVSPCKALNSKSVWGLFWLLGTWSSLEVALGDVGVRYGAGLELKTLQSKKILESWDY